MNSNNETNETLKNEILRVSNSLGIKLDKKSGQCILIDDNLANFVVNSAELDKDVDIVLEIGPGFGVLTRKILKYAKKVIVIENDSKLSNYLTDKFSKADNISIIHGDAIKVNFPKNTKLISNVPYHISGPLIQKIIFSKEKPKKIILMLQREFIEKMMASPQPKKYGRISVITKLFFDIKILKKVGTSVFYPKPLVQSGIIELNFKVAIDPILQDKNQRLLFFKFLSGIFPYKNKTLVKALSLFFENFQKNQKDYSKEMQKFLQTLELEEIKDFKNKMKSKYSSKRLWQIDANEILNIFSELFIRRKSFN